jgi:hypothetical protein
MPGEFYIEQLQLSLNVKELYQTVNRLLERLSGKEPVWGSTRASWSTESDVISLGETDKRLLLHSLLLGVGELCGSLITVRMYMKVGDLEQKVYQQSFTPPAITPGLWIVNGTVGIHNMLKVTLQSNDSADDGRAVYYDYMVQEM